MRHVVDLLVKRTLHVYSSHSYNVVESVELDTVADYQVEIGDIVHNCFVLVTPKLLDHRREIHGMFDDIEVCRDVQKNGIHWIDKGAIVL